MKLAASQAEGALRPTDTGPVKGTPVVPRYSYYALAILSLVNFLNYIDRQVLPAVAPLMLKDPQLKLTHAELGYIEAALLLSFTVLAPLFGRLGDRRSRTKLMASAAVIWSVATALSGWVDRLPFLPSGVQLHLPWINFTLAMSGAALALCLVRAVVGVGESSYSTITPSLIADYFPPQRRATALGVFQAAIPLGFALGFVIGGGLAYFFGWRMAFMIVGVPGIITAAIVWRLREPVRGATDEPAHATALEEIELGPAETAAALQVTSGEVQESFVRTAWRILSTRDWILSTAGYTALTFALGAFATWATVLLVEDKKMSATNAAITLGVVTLLGGAVGTFGGGWLSDRLIARRRNAYFLVCAVATLLGILPTSLALSSDDARVYLPAIFFAVMLLFISNAPFHAILVNSVPTLVRATAVALNIVIIHTFGDAISRAAVGVISDSLSAGHLSTLAAFARTLGIDAAQQHLSAALLVAPAALVISTIFFFWGASMQHAEHKSH
ncbi:MAG: transporter, Spinster family, sphingosine-phosphate transporter [Blastocatellia bacterium]|jgi:MFS family permease|nr:transporter, Spinster family, sphingosine-phosphate transporter [Blastocatellia bacterium]